MIEGGTDANLFENFIYNMLNKLRRDPEMIKKHFVILMDNATIHKSTIVYKTARGMKTTILFNAKY